MNRIDYNISEWTECVNAAATRIINESYACEDFDAQQVSEQIDEAQATYNKIQKILNCPEMIKSHAYLYALDMENVDECDKKKVDDLYALGMARGVIQEDKPSDTNANDDGINECDGETGDICGGPADALTGQEMIPGERKPVMQSASFTVLYSAMKDGQVKTGEYFSSATDSDAAKADCISNLTPLGYSSIRVLGIEQTNNAIEDTGMGYLDEDDSKEFEDQETGAADTTTDNDAESKPEDDAEKPKDTPKNDGTQDGAEGNEKTDDSSEKADDKKSDDNQTEDSGAEGDSKPGDEKKKLTPSEKQVLRDEYVGMFKAELQKTKLEKSVNDMSIKEKASFYGTISQKWTKQDPEEFMSQNEIKKLCDTVIKN